MFMLKLPFIPQKLVIVFSQSNTDSKAYIFEGNHDNNDHVINWLIQYNAFQGNRTNARSQQDFCITTSRQ